MTLENVQYPSSERNWRAGGAEHTLLVDFYLSFIAQFQSYLYIYIYYINNSKKRVISLIKILIIYIIRVHEMYDTNIYIMYI